MLGCVVCLLIVLVSVVSLVFGLAWIFVVGLRVDAILCSFVLVVCCLCLYILVGVGDFVCELACLSGWVMFGLLCS